MLKRFASHFRHNVVAYLALFFALGGTALAAKPLITGADVQDASLTGADVSDDSTLKGLDIDESDLGKVPSAGFANFAEGARRAGDVNRPFKFPTGRDLGPMLTQDGLVISAGCSNGSATLELSLPSTDEVPDPDALFGYLVGDGTIRPFSGPRDLPVSVTTVSEAPSLYVVVASGFGATRIEFAGRTVYDQGVPRGCEFIKWQTNSL